MPVRLLQGAGVALKRSDGAPVRRLLIGATWSNPQMDVDMSALLLARVTSGFQTATREHFLYRRRLRVPDFSAFLTYSEPGEVVGPDRAQFLVDFGETISTVGRIMISFSAMPNEVLNDIGTVRTRAMDLDTGETMFVYQHPPQGLKSQCATLWQLDRVGSQWDARITATPYPGGPGNLIRDHGAALAG